MEGMTQRQKDEHEIRTTTLNIAGMLCRMCVRHVTRALDGMTGVVHVDVDLQNNRAIVEHLSDYVDTVALLAAVRDAGYQASVARSVADTDLAPARSDAPTRCQCHCCGGSPNAPDDWWNLGTSTIG